jgi:energy-coupling factor transport system substrate-specific component
MIVTGAAALLYPFWLPGHAAPDDAHAADAPVVAGLLAALVVMALVLEIRRGTMNGATVALLGVLSAVAGLLRLFDLPGGGNGVFFLVILAGAAFGPRFGTLLGLTAMGVSAVVTGGVGPWLPFQMLALSWMGGGAGLVGLATRRLGQWPEVAVLVAYGWVWGFLYGAVMNLWFWPFVRDGGPLSWSPGLSAATTVRHYWSFYVATSLAWDAAGAFVNAALIAATAGAILPGMRRFAHRLDPVVELVPA